MSEENYIVKTTTVVSRKDIADLMTGALEGGCNYWLDSVTPRYEKHEDYSEADAYGPNMKPRIFKAEDDDNEYVLDHTAIMKGLQLMSDRCPSHFHDFVSENSDADTSDVFLQLCLFGGIVYG